MEIEARTSFDNKGYCGKIMLWFLERTYIMGHEIVAAKPLIMGWKESQSNI
jgi:hypothetical protein